MGNIAFLDQMDFKSKKGTESHGFVFYDNDNECVFMDLVRDENRSDLDLLRIVDDLRFEYEGIENILNFCSLESRGIEINGTFYEFDQIKGIIDPDIEG